jgi:hypothetical protein
MGGEGKDQTPQPYLNIDYVPWQDKILLARASIGPDVAAK